ncbi:early nodulin-like protein 3 [Olea europaea var. sylvestris]|uniref:early nodulin-like protein 3 n=1 Tax=Olea europaea var. sylvestris TaxID=158386 RepID=UPI000C1D3702|nr:early nodulin-like protein 3 [Olea europaea var. sylvestris]
MASLKIIFLFSTVVFLLCVRSEAREFVIDGENNLWAVPFSVDEFNKWAEKTHFQFGDSLVLKYDSKTESVLEVTEEDYKICNNANPIKSHHDGETTNSLEKSGLFFFISGVEEHCYNDQKLEVMVLSDKHGSSHQSTMQAPSPHHHRHHYHAAVPAPTNGGTGLKATVGFICVTAAVGSFVSLCRLILLFMGCNIELYFIFIILFHVYISCF